jgi:hypothetical protein
LKGRRAFLLVMSAATGTDKQAMNAAGAAFGLRRHDVLVACPAAKTKTRLFAFASGQASKNELLAS